MNLPIAGTLALIVLVAILRLGHQARRDGWQRWRLAALLAGNTLAAMLLYATLWPPAAPGQAGALLVLTEGAVVPTRSEGARIVALPEAGQPANIERVPDLGTALRRYPGASPVRVLGAGLTPRDRDAARGVDLRFEPTPLPNGIVELNAPTHAQQGRRFTVTGRVESAGADATVDLLDAAGRRVDRATPDAEGRFTLSAMTGPAGRVAYRLEHRDAAGELRESLALPLQVEAGTPLRIAMLSGGASPELKYLRRWSLDAGFKLHTQISLGGGVDIGDPPLAMNATTLREFDLVVLDERAWRSLGDGGRAALDDAAAAGLGVLLRITGTLSATELTRLGDAGFALENADVTRGVRLANTDAADAAPSARQASTTTVEATATDAAPLLTRRPLRLTAGDSAALLRDAQGEVLALWRTKGRGRMAVWVLSDTYRLALSGRGAAYGETWGHAFEVLARPLGKAAPALPLTARVGDRTRLCRLPATARLSGPDGKPIAHIADRTDCAATWPELSGWYELTDGDQRWAFPVRAADEAPGLRAAERRDATRAIAASAPARTAVAREVTGKRWPWALAWLLVSTLLWWLERSRAGR